MDRLRGLAARERAATAEFMACLAEADRREKTVVVAGWPTLFAFCVRELKLSEGCAYKRVRTARLIRTRPEILSLLGDGSINLSNLSLIEPWLESRPGLLREAIGKSKREVEALIASIGGRRDVPDRVRALAVRVASRPVDEQPSLLSPQSDSGMPEPASKMDGTPASPESLAEPPSQEPRDLKQPRESAESEPTLEIRFAASRRFVLAIESLRALLWHKYPTGRFEDVLFEAAENFIAERDPARKTKKCTSRNGPPAGKPRTRRIPSALRRAVWRRDGGRCSYVGTTGRCGETRGLEIDHVQPWALGGRSDLESNLRLLCRAHNQSEARRVFECPRGGFVDNSRENTKPALG